MLVLIADATRKRLLPGAIPTLNLPQKSFETETKPTLSNAAKLTRIHLLQVQVKNQVEYTNI